MGNLKPPLSQSLVATLKEKDVPQRLNARDYYYKYIAPQENYKSYQEFYQNDILQKQLQATQDADELESIHRVLNFKPDSSNDFSVNEHIKIISSLVDQKLRNYLHSVFVAKRNNFIANAAAAANLGNYDGDLVYFYVGISHLCEQYSALFAPFLSLRQLKSNPAYDKNEAQRLATHISEDAMKLAIALSHWQEKDTYIKLEHGLILGSIGFDVNEMDRLSFGMKDFTDRFILCHEISHHLLGHTGRTDIGSSYLQKLIPACQLWHNRSVEHAHELQADALAVLLLTGETDESSKSSRDFDSTENAINDAMLGSLLTQIALGEIMGSMTISSSSHPAAETRYQQCLAILEYSQRQHPGVELFFDEDILQFRRMLAGIHNLINSNSQNSESL